MEIHALTESDLVGGLHLSRLAGWNQTLSDWKILYDQPFKNNWVAKESKTIIGTAMSLHIPPNTAWIGMVLVHPDYRSRGIGRQLMQKVIQHCQADIIRLDASRMGFPLYQKMGFKVDERITRYVLRSRGHSQINTFDNINSIKVSDLPAIYTYDKLRTGVIRKSLIHAFCDHGTGFIYREEGEVSGYILGRKGDKSYHIGPVLADRLETAKELIRAKIISLENLPISIDVFDRHPSLVNFLQDLNFEKTRSFYRMTYKALCPHMDRFMYCSFDPAMS